jgi:hypothetical protein
MSNYPSWWGTFCTPEEYAESLLDNAPITCLNRGESIGMAVSVLL